MVMKGDSVESDVSEQNSEECFETLDQIEEKASSIFEFSLQFVDVSESLEKEEEERLRVVEAREKELCLLEDSVSRRASVLEEKEIEFDLRQVIEATIVMLVVEKQSEEAENNKLGLLLDSTTKELKDMMSEFEGKKEEARQMSEFILEKLSELEKAKMDFDLKQRDETERQNKESKAREKELKALDEAITEKTAELKRKEETFELKLKEEADKLRGESELSRIKEKELEKMLKEIELKQMKLEERLKQELIEAESRKRSNLESEAREKKLNSLEEPIKEKTAELKRKEETFELKLKEEADKLREETELRRNGLEIKEKALEKLLKEVELKQMDLEERSKQQRIEAESRKRSNLESDEREKELNSLEEALKEKTAELKRKEEAFELKLKEEADKLRVETELRRSGLEIKEKALEKMLKEVELKQMDLKEKSKQQLIDAESRKRSNLESEAREKELKALEEAIKEKTSELKRKEGTFELKLKEEADKLREENELKRKGLGMKEEPLELELQQVELKERSNQQLVEAESRKRSNLELGPSLLANNDSDAASLTRQAKKQKPQEASDGDIEEIVCTDKSYKDPKLLTFPDRRIHDFSKSMSSFAVDQVWALYDPRDDMPRIYAQVRRIFDSQLSLEVTLLEHVKTTKDEKATLSGCGSFEYGDTEIKNHLMFVHEMDHIACANNVTVNPRKGETWALFRDWNASWNSHPGLHEPPYRYDYVEVISDFDDLSGIAVAYMGKGFLSVFNRAEQHDGLVKNIVPPGEMQKFSHKVASFKLSGNEKEGIPAGSFELNPAATPSYDSVSEEVVKIEIQSKDCGKALTVVHENGSTKDLPIIID
ncbi:PREDICTED: trichohyalin-like [Camelina sativa]|uniref:Trichohyalin-like n=1 Tax=Camelina sativa TaxID=90675 RepID=A0ABM1QSR0_CAMSA|nr:PREDICTED: trichohyalin-like [Camelina sativa]XP_019089798.1 PREDICTED: trichohyalin-like [Camelina sativa]